MPDNTALFDALDALPLLARLAAREGMDVVSPEVRTLAVSKAREVIRGMSGATFAGTGGYTATDDDDGTAAFELLYDEAAAALENFTGHDGRPLAEDAGEDVPANVVRYVLTTPTTYAADLETDNAGEKAFMGDAFTEAVPVLFGGAVAGLKELFGG
jgi:hypothetical protein